MRSLLQTRWQWSSLALASVLAVAMAGVLPADENDSDAERIAAVSAMAKQFVEKCEFTLGEPAAKLALHPEPLLRWSNPTAGKVFGEVYLWTDQGRPAVVASIYRWFSPNWGRTLEVSALSSDRLIGRIEDARFWTPGDCGVSFKPLSEAEPPAKSPAARLVQMRRLANEFAAELADMRREDSKVNRQLRLLTQPVYRYPQPSAPASYADGALFAFVEGTDPEVLLMLEAAPSSDGPRWQYAVARMNRDALRVTYRDQTVWNASKLTSKIGLSKDPYTLFSLERPLAEKVE